MDNKSMLKNLPDLPNSQDYSIQIVDLKDFPRTEFNNHVDGENGPIDFYNIPEGTKVLTLNEATKMRQWSDVKYWSKHKGRILEIVTLANGTQILTDDDPRAIYGITKENFETKNYKFERFTPSQAYTKNVLVPIINEFILPKCKISDFDMESLIKDIKTLDDARNIVLDFFKQGIKLGITFKAGYWDLFETKHIPSKIHDIENSEISFAEIVAIEKTGQKFDGYDLTVPGPETFCNVFGTILSNTINVHVPGLDEAQTDIKERLLPSKQLFAIRDNREIMNKLKQDLISGMYATNKATPERKWLFKTKAEALEAIKNGKVKFSDEVEILEK